jgi:hypothetical protein
MLKGEPMQFRLDRLDILFKLTLFRQYPSRTATAGGCTTVRLYIHGCTTTAATATATSSATAAATTITTTANTLVEAN